MQALVVHESMFGNTAHVADAVADGLRAAGLEVSTVEVGEAPTAFRDLDLVVVGAPTHAFGLSRPSTREDAAQKAAERGEDLTSAGIGLREWIEEVEPAAGVAVAAFDTRVRRPRLPGSAARAARKRLRARGLRAVDPPTTFWVDGMFGPLLPGEEERARDWGTDLGTRVREHATNPR